MTTITAAREAVYQRFVDNFTGVIASRITFDNESYDPDGTDPWVRLAVRTSNRLQSTLGGTGNRRFRSTASVLVQVFAEVDTGVKSLDELAKEAADIFEGRSFSGLDFQAVTIRETGPDGRWAQYLVEAEFDYDEIK